MGVLGAFLVRRLTWLWLIPVALVALSCAPSEDGSTYKAPAEVERKADDGDPVYSAEERATKAAMPK